MKSYSFDELTKIGRKELGLDDSWKCFMAEALEQTGYRYMLYGLESGDEEVYGLVPLYER